MSRNEWRRARNKDGNGLAEDEELLVFGYSCKLFRDDEKALTIDKGQHLIPWMGDASLPIDRYDVRGLLYDIAQHEPKSVEPNLKNSDFMSPEDIRLEEMCDEERYLFLNYDNTTGINEDNVDEESKKGHTNAIGYDYSRETRESAVLVAQPKVSPEEYIRSLANILEKTAQFISTQGPQMEIMMRAREASNPKLQFLNPDNPYHPIYKQVLEKKRDRLKNPVSYGTTYDEKLDVEESIRNLTRNLPSAAPGLNSKSDASAQKDQGTKSAYSKLVEKILENQAAEKALTPPPEQPPPQLPPPEEKVLVTVPPALMQRIIDQTACYACKNGVDKFPVLSKFKPEQFEFLSPESKYHMFYKYKIALYKELFGLAQNGSLILTSKKKFPTLKGFF